MAGVSIWLYKFLAIASLLLFVNCCLGSIISLVSVTPNLSLSLALFVFDLVRNLERMLTHAAAYL